MNVVVLCGGIGSRLDNYSFPKPLNMIYGTPAISYTLQNLPPEIRKVYFIYSPHLEKYNFEQIIINQFKERQCIFFKLPYFTRGPVESAWCGLKYFNNDDEPIVLLDNDILYNFPRELFDIRNTAFLGYSINDSSSEAFSFIQLTNAEVTMVKEKKRISNNFICGVYGFKSIQQFREAALNCLLTSTENELYLSILFEHFINTKQSIQGVYFPTTQYHIGSLKELKYAIQHIPCPKMRICFDLDNTLVTYPEIPGDYSSVKPIPTMIQLAQKLHSEGHTIIIHTARRMTTHKHNIGAVIRDIGKQTFDTLDTFEIPYDELIFGKPIADMYIDDRAVNPYRCDMESMGLIDYKETTMPINKLNNNKHNSIELDGNIIIKRGPIQYLRGEIYYYEHLSPSLSISNFFPKYFGSTVIDTIAEIRTEYIRGIPIYTLYKAELLTQGHIKRLFEIIDCLHTTKGDRVPTLDIVRRNYIDKLEHRFEDKHIYNFPDTETYKNICINELNNYLNTSPNIVSYIHGDFWFSNILLDFKNNIKLIDMKGRLEEHLTMGGDCMYDYGKLYQSILGYDLILYNETVSNTYKEQVKDYFFHEIRMRNIDEQHLRTVTFALIIGTLFAVESNHTRTNIWNWAKNLFYPEHIQQV